MTYTVGMTKRQWLQIGVWTLSSVAVMIAVIAWGQTYAWHFKGLSIYQLFPLLGLVAFSLMWSHYMASVGRQYLRLDKKVLRSYFEATAGLVLAAILLHPGLLSWQLWRDGMGLPPGSELDYVMPTARYAIFFGFIAVSVFLLYELRRVYDKRPWWKYVQYASDAAMLLIFFHALELGGALQTSWFRTVWYFYGVTLVAALAYIYYHKFHAPVAKE
jgi:hypothetical protein